VVLVYFMLQAKNANIRPWSAMRINKNLLRTAAIIAGLVLLIAAARYFGFGGRFLQLKIWIQSLGFWGPFVFAVIYALAVTALVPGSAMTVAAGALFGTARGIITVSFASTLGAALSFLIARYLARGAVERWLGENEKFKKLDELSEKRGAAIVAVTRLVPLFPFTLLNYGFGLTRVRFSTYLFWSWLCMLPGTVLYVAGSDAVSKFITHEESPLSAAAAFAAAGILLFILFRYAKNKLKGT